MDPNAGKRNLVNKLSREELQAKLEGENFDRITLSFYKYVIIDNPQELRDELFQQWFSWDCLGRIYVSHQGINAQMNIPQEHWTDFEKSIRSNQFFHDVPFKIAVTDKTEGKSFLKLKVKVREQIVADGLQLGDYDVTDVGKHLDAKSWNEAIENDDPLVVDMRNHYESEIGHFEGAVLPEAETFRDELPMVLEKLKGQENRKVLLYCTGGIRCEKTSAYLKHHGFADVNQLHGGIIDYARQIDQENLPNKFHGVNFVFDERLGEEISQEVISECHQCGQPSARHANCINKACNLLWITLLRRLGLSPACLRLVQGRMVSDPRRGRGFGRCRPVWSCMGSSPTEFAGGRVGGLGSLSPDRSR